MNCSPHGLNQTPPRPVLQRSAPAAERGHLNALKCRCDACSGPTGASSSCAGFFRATSHPEHRAASLRVSCDVPDDSG
jgi:hypothetical protein